MSGRIIGEVLTHAPKDLTQLELLTLICLAESARTNTRTARYQTSAKQIADRIHSTPSSTKSVLFKLRQRGLIIGIHDKPRQGRAQEYHIPPLTEATHRATHKGGPRSTLPTPQGLMGINPYPHTHPVDNPPYPPIEG